MAVKKKSVRKAPLKSTQTQRASSPPSKRKLIIAGLFVIAIAVLFQLRGHFIAAMVNGKPISRMAVVEELEKRSGKGALDNLITKNLILQAAEKKEIDVTDAEIDNEIKTIEKNVKAQGQKLNSLLEAQGLDRDELKEQIKVQKLLQKMLGKDITVSTKEVDTFIEENKDSIPAEAKPEQVRADVERQLQQQKLSEKSQKFLSDLKAKAKISYFVEY